MWLLHTRTLSTTWHYNTNNSTEEGLVNWKGNAHQDATWLIFLWSFVQINLNNFSPTDNDNKIHLILLLQNHHPTTHHIVSISKAQDTYFNKQKLLKILFEDILTSLTPHCRSPQWRTLPGTRLCTTSPSQLCRKTDQYISLHGLNCLAHINTLCLFVHPSIQL